MDKKINPVKKLKGEISLKGDKSISHRAVMIASLAEGRSTIKNFLKADDCLSTADAFRKMGVDIDIAGGDIIVNGRGLTGLKKPKGEIYLGNSGTSMRLLAGILAGQDFSSLLTGDESLSQRPMDRVIEPLRLMGADIKGKDDRYAPLMIRGKKLRAIKYRMKVSSGQVKSAIIFAGLYADGVTMIEEPVKSRDHTERMLSLFGAKLEIDGLRVSVHGRPRLKGRPLAIPGDISSAAFFITAASLLPGSEIILNETLLNRTRFGFIYTLEKMGACISVENKRFNGYEDVCDLVVRSNPLKGVTIDEENIPSMIDELPILMVAASLASGVTRIKGAGELRVKETDRIISMSRALKKMGADMSVVGNDITIRGVEKLNGADMESLGDHRTAMSLVIAALAARGESRIRNVDCINTSFPEFFQILDSLAAR